MCVCVYTCILHFLNVNDITSQHVKSLLKDFFFIANWAWIGLQNQKYLCSCSLKPRVQWKASWQGLLAVCHSHLWLQCSPRGKNNHEFCLTRAIEWHLFLDGLWGLLLRQTRWKPFKSYFLWLWEDQRAEEVLRIEIMLFVRL